MALRIVTSPSATGLERALLRELCSGGDASPLSRRHVVVPSAVMANHVRRRLAERAGGGVVMGVETALLPVFAERLFRTAGLASGKNQASRWSLALDVLLLGQLSLCEESHPLHRMLASSAGIDVIRRTILDLADAGFAGHTTLLAEVADEVLDNRIERAVVGVFCQFVDATQQAGLAWQPLAVTTLTERIDSNLVRRAFGLGEQPLALYVSGFTRLPDYWMELLVALSRVGDVTVMLPGSGEKGHPTFNNAAAIAESLTLRAGAGCSVEHEPDDDPVTHFFVSSFPDGELPEQAPSFVVARRACGVGAEVTAAAAFIAGEIEAGTDPSDIVVAVPSLSRYGVPLTRALSAFAIPHRPATGTFGRQRSSAIVPILERWWSDDAPSEWALAALTQHAEHIPIASDVNVGRLQMRLRRAGIWGGASLQMILDAQEDPDELADDRLSEPERRLLAALLEDFVEPTDDPMTVAEAHRWLQRVRDRWTGPLIELDELLAALATLEGAPGPATFDRGVILRLASRARRWARDPQGSNRQGVAIVSSSRAVGLTAEVMVTLGLSHDALPARTLEDPYIGDSSRAALSTEFRKALRDVGHAIALSSDASSEAALGFHLRCTAAARSVWIVPITDDLGRQTAASPWIQRYLERYPGLTQASRVPRGPSEQARLFHTAGAVFCPPNLAMLVDPTVATSAALFGDEIAELVERDAQRRGGRPELNGLVGDDARPAKISVSNLEKLARCPFAWFGAQVLRLRAVEPLVFRTQLEPSVRGRLFHQLAASLMGRVCHRPYPRLTESEAQLRQALQSSIEHVAWRNRTELAALADPLRRAEIRRLQHTMTRYLDAVGVELPDGRPVRFERALSRTYDGIEIEGRVDRIDQRRDRWFLIDYKTGRRPSKREQDRDLRLGLQLQSALYPWLAEPMAPRDRTRFVFQYIGDLAEAAVVEAPAPVILQHFLSLLRAGVVLPTPTAVWNALGATNRVKPCRFCRYDAACRRFDDDLATRNVGLLEANAPARAARIRQAFLQD